MSVSVVDMMRPQRELDGGGRTIQPIARNARQSIAAPGGRRAAGSDSFEGALSSAAQESAADASKHPFSTGPGAKAPAALTTEEQVLVDRIAKSVGAPAGQLTIEEETSPKGARSNGTRQFIVTVDPQQSTPATILMQGAQEQALPLAEDAAAFDYDAISMVKDRLAKNGIDPAAIQFEYWDDVINNVGGQRTFHYLSADLGNGTKENFSLEWTLYNPDITATEIARLMGRSRLNGSLQT